MTFTLEALRAKQGDALLLHYGTAGDPRLIVVDGGPRTVFAEVLRPRLEALRQARDPATPLPIRLLMVSHIDDDHIRGVLDLADWLLEAQQAGSPPPFRVTELWHNSFDDIVGNDAEELLGAGEAAVATAGVDGVLPELALRSPAALVLASVRQGRRLRDAAAALGLALNASGTGGIGGQVVARDGGAAIPLGAGLSLQVIAPRHERLAALQRDWSSKVASLASSGGLTTPAALAEAAAYVDGSVYNLSSLVVLAECGGRTMLLTGDARGDDILTGLDAAGALTDGALHVDLFKLPHHGSDRNVETDLFRRVTADHYVVSGDGTHGNPEPATFEMLFAARGADPFTLHLTYPLDELTEPTLTRELEGLFNFHRHAGAAFGLTTPMPDRLSVVVAL